jgi:prepilin-type processing-associated H-X9-DG protein
MNEPHKPEMAKPTGRRFQFGMKVLFALPVVVAVFFSVASYWGLGAAILFFVAVFGTAGLFCSTTRRITIVALAALLATALLLPMWSRAVSPARRCQCGNNVNRIVRALHNYHDAHGSFPPTYVADENGRPMHSWRVLLLPFLDQQLLYEQYDFDEPWDGPNNSRLAAQTPDPFQCPEEPRRMIPTTSYVAVIGSETMWPGSQPISLNDFTDDPAETLLVVEVANSGINWMEPRDLDISAITLEVNPKNGRGISSLHPGSRFPREPGGAHVAFADGSVRFLPDTTVPEDLRAMLTRSDGESIDIDDATNRGAE